MTSNPSCPRCGSARCEVVSTTAWWGTLHVRLRCRRCGHAFYGADPSTAESPTADPPTHAEPEPTTHAEAPPPRQTRYAWPIDAPLCPACGGASSKVQSTHRAAEDGMPFRWRKCGGCGRRWKETPARV